MTDRKMVREEAVDPPDLGSVSLTDYVHQLISYHGDFFNRTRWQEVFRSYFDPNNQSKRKGNGYY